ncbi:hypothetical protein [Shewanella khirikhana]|uniref:hypothetical protein n=1 Tax=Shewanella khirikhana TaxID=1965282 RepID=UPI000F7DAC91|nr:hypothetical protein [Shewanella khirikhana]
MNIDATLAGLVILVFALLMGAVSYYLGCRKTQTPILTAVLGMLLSLIPPLALIFVAVLVFKKDVNVAGCSH